jgi:hypothetical protein
VDWTRWGSEALAFFGSDLPETPYTPQPKGENPMRTRITLMTIMLLAAPLLAMADEAAELRKKIMFDEKKLVVMENMEFTEAEAKGFWPVYEQYQEKLFQNSQLFGQLIVSYATNYQSLTDQKALELIDKYYEARSERQKIMQNYTGDLKKVLPGRKIFRYLQVENKLEAIARFELAKEIPLAKQQ